MLGSLTPEEIDRLLLEAHYCHLGCHGYGRTLVVPMSFAVEAENSLVGQTTIGLKVDIMRLNPEVCVCVDKIEKLTEWRSAVLRGRYEELSGIDAAQAMSLLIGKYGEIFHGMDAQDRRGRVVTPPRLDQAHSPPVVYRIVVSEKSGRFEKP